MAEYSLLSYSTNRNTVPPSLIPNWALIVNETIGQFISLSDNGNTPVYPTSVAPLPSVLPGNIQFLNGSGINIVAGTNTLTINAVGSGNETLTGDDGVPVAPSAGTIRLAGITSANFLTVPRDPALGPVYTYSSGGNVEVIASQYAVSVASTNHYYAGLASFDSGLFQTDSQGWTTGATGVFPATDGQLMIGNSLTGYPIAAVPLNGTNISWTPGHGTLQANLTGSIAVSQGGTGQTSLTAHGILIGEGTSAVTSKVLSSGQLLIGSSGDDPAISTLTSGGSITVTPGAGTLSLDVSSSSNFINFIPGANVQINSGTSAVPIALGGSVTISAVAQGEVVKVFHTAANYTAQITDYMIVVVGNYIVTLPASPNLGQVIIVSDGVGGSPAITVNANTGNKIAFNTGLQDNVFLTCAFGSYTFIYVGSNIWLIT